MLGAEGAIGISASILFLIANGNPAVGHVDALQAHLIRPLAGPHIDGLEDEDKYLVCQNFPPANVDTWNVPQVAKNCLQVNDWVVASYVLNI